MDIKCPGQNTQFWKPEDVFEFPCFYCKATLEFFKDEPKIKCFNCGKEAINPRVDFGCALWCKKASECIGEERYLQLTKSAKKEAVPDKYKTKKELLLFEMEKYFGQDLKRINHAKCVLAFAQILLDKEKADRLVVVASAILHDIGIHMAERKHKNSGGHFQEIEGPPIARAIMEKLQLGKETIDEVCTIIANHHSPGKINTTNFKVLYDADCLVNLRDEFDTKDKDKLAKVIENIFLTESGKELAKEQYLFNPKLSG